MFIAAFVAYYLRKRAQGKEHNAAVLCVARRRCNIILPMLKTQTPYQPREAEKPPHTGWQQDRDTPALTGQPPTPARPERPRRSCPDTASLPLGCVHRRDGPVERTTRPAPDTRSWLTPLPAISMASGSLTNPPTPRRRHPPADS